MAEQHHHCHQANKQLAIEPKLKIALSVLTLLLGISYLPFSVFIPLNQSLLSYLATIWWAVLLGLLLGGVISHFVPENFIFKMLGGRTVSSLGIAVLAGFLLSACSHGILAIAIQLFKKGASIPATITFLLASPWANLPVTILLFGFFGWYALLFIFAAMTIALVTGLVFQFLEKIHWIESSPQIQDADSVEWKAFEKFSVKDSLKGVSLGTLHLANMVLWWIIVGLILAALIGAYVPHHLFTDYFDASLSGLGLTLLAATIIEVCSEGSSPIAFEIFQQTAALGNPFVFLMAGVVTDYTEIGLLWTNIGKRTALWLPAITVPQVLLVGYLFNEYLVL